MSHILQRCYIGTLPKGKPGRICRQYIEQKKYQYYHAKNDEYAINEFADQVTYQNFKINLLLSGSGTAPPGISR